MKPRSTVFYSGVVLPFTKPYHSASTPPGTGTTLSAVKLSVQALKHPVHLLALGFGAGLVPKLPGTAGTLIGVLLFIPMQQLLWQYYSVVIVLMFLSGIWLCGRTAAYLGVHDHPGIVWDEIVGYLFTMIMAPQGWEWILLGFSLFRLFDILKQWPIGWIDKRVHGGFGIMADDALAAVYSLISLQIIAYLLKS